MQCAACAPKPWWSATRFCMQVLTLPPCPQLSEAAGEVKASQSVFIPGVAVHGNPAIRMVLLPVKDASQPRTAIFVLARDHPFWRIATADALYAYFALAFPQIQDWHALLPREAAEQFVQTREGVFNHPQCCRRLVHLMPHARVPERAQRATGGLRGCAALLLGDAAHVFPPGTRAPVELDVRFMLFVYIVP